jgi:hypothetical protein
MFPGLSVRIDVRAPEGSSLACVHPTRRRSTRVQHKTEGGGKQMAPHQDPQTRSRPIMGEDGPSDSALAACSGWRLRLILQALPREQVKTD